jgi:hypothetical protein
MLDGGLHPQEIALSLIRNFLIAYTGYFWDSPQCFPQLDGPNTRNWRCQMLKLLIYRMGKNLVPNTFPESRNPLQPHRQVY